MRKRTAAFGLAAALTIFPTTSAFAETQSAPAQEETTDDDDGDKTGLWGLVGLLGLAGLAGLKRRDRNDYRGTSTGGSTATR
jgi:MYXO-CTERM domain-containing protein